MCDTNFIWCYSGCTSIGMWCILNNVRKRQVAATYYWECEKCRGKKEISQQWVSVKIGVRSWAVPFKKCYAPENVGYSVRGWDHFKCSPEWLMHFHILNSLCHWWICFFYRIGSHITDAYIRSSGIGMLFFAMCCWTISRNFVHFSVPWFVGEIFSPVTSLILWFFTTYYFKAIQITISLCLIHFCVQS